MSPGHPLVLRASTDARPDANLRSPTACVVAVLSMGTVVPLLGWVAGLAPFHVGLLAVGLPGLAAVTAVSAWLARTRPDAALTQAIRVGVVAGLVGTLGYDLFRTPFVLLGGYRLLSPIESYGVLLLDASGSSGLTDLAGWAYHFSNGILFAIAYAALAYRRHWAWGVAWALVLESGTLVTPFADTYHLWANPSAIVLAYAAHVPYGLALGLTVQRGDAVAAALARFRLPVPRLLAIGFVGLVLWLEPWQRPQNRPGGAHVVIVDGVFEPEFTRVPEGVCPTVANLDDTPYQLTTAGGEVAVAGAGQTPLCLAAGVHRVRTTGAPFDGGFVIVDPTVEG